MDIAIAPQTEWRTRGRAPRPVPEKLRQLLDASYRTGDLVQIDDIATPEDHQEARDTVSLARTYAKANGRSLQVQPQHWDRYPHTDDAAAVTRILFKMVDPRGKKK